MTQEIMSELAMRCRDLANRWQQMAADSGEHQYAGCAADLYAVLVQVGKHPAPARMCATCKWWNNTNQPDNWGVCWDGYTRKSGRPCDYKGWEPRPATGQEPSE